MEKIANSLITNNGLKIAINRIYKSTPDYTASSQFKVGVGTIDPVAGDTALGTPIPLDGTEAVDDCETADWTVSSSGTITLNSTTYKEGSNALNLIKTGTATPLLTANKATTSVDFTSKDLSVWFYVKDATAYAKLSTTGAVQIRFGSDASNYYYWDKDKADLGTGWNLLSGLNTSSASGSVGTGTLTAMDYSYIGITSSGTTDTWSSGDFIMDDWKVISSDDYLKNFETGFPTLDETANEATIRCKLTSVQANGYNISEIGVFNTDSTPLLQSRATFTPISKSNTDEILFIIKDKITRG